MRLDYAIFFLSFILLLLDVAFSYCLQFAIAIYINIRFSAHYFTDALLSYHTFAAATWQCRRATMLFFCSFATDALFHFRAAASIILFAAFATSLPDAALFSLIAAPLSSMIFFSAAYARHAPCRHTRYCRHADTLLDDGFAAMPHSSMFFISIIAAAALRYFRCYDHTLMSDFSHIYAARR